VICNNAKVLDKAVLKDCEVASDFVVEKESKWF
jgi:translation initiation factor eIF-2B subunit gamma